MSLMKHHPEEITEHLLSQPLPLDPGTALCWKEIGNNDFLGPRVGSFIFYIFLYYTYRTMYYKYITLSYFASGFGYAANKTRI